MQSTADISIKRSGNRFRNITPQKRFSIFRNLIDKYLARKRFNSIKKALKEVEQFENGNINSNLSINSLQNFSLHTTENFLKEANALKKKYLYISDEKAG